MLPLLLAFVMPLAAQSSDAPAQAARGRALFFDANAKTACGTCHAIENKGTAVGPKLTDLARLSPKAVVVAIKATRTVHAKEIELKDGRKFPGMVSSEANDQVVLYDLSQSPPEKLTVTKADVKLPHKDNSSWRHPPSAAEYTDEQLADIIAYIRWVGFGDKKGVTTDDLY